VNDLESVERTTDQGSYVVLHISCDTFLCMSVHHNNKRHNGGLHAFALSFLACVLPSRCNSSGINLRGHWEIP